MQEPIFFNVAETLPSSFFMPKFILYPKEEVEFKIEPK